jgi:hypothetical protein
VLPTLSPKHYRLDGTHHHEFSSVEFPHALAAIEPGARSAAALDLVRSLENIYASHQAPRPAWLSAVRDEYRRSDEQSG